MTAYILVTTRNSSSIASQSSLLCSALLCLVANRCARCMVCTPGLLNALRVCVCVSTYITLLVLAPLIVALTCAFVHICTDLL